MSGYVFIGGKFFPNSYVPAGRAIRIDYGNCRACEGTGVLLDINGEPEMWCGCTIGEAVRQAGNAGGAK